jgi:iron-sulfur cluster assembly protein
MITLTEQAQEQIKLSIRKRSGSVGIRIGVKTTGCSGLAYVLEFLQDNKFSPYDEEFIYQDFIIRISSKDLIYLKGLEIDWGWEGLNGGFKFNNPNERDRCGCGESFRV